MQTSIKSDIYSLGVIFYYLLTKNHPSIGGLKLSELNDVSKGTIKLIKDMSVFNPKERLNSMKLVTERIEKIINYKRILLKRVLYSISIITILLVVYLKADFDFSNKINEESKRGVVTDVSNSSNVTNSKEVIESPKIDYEDDVMFFEDSIRVYEPINYSITPDSKGDLKPIFIGMIEDETYKYFKVVLDKSINQVFLFLASDTPGYRYEKGFNVKKNTFYFKISKTEIKMFKATLIIGVSKYYNEFIHVVDERVYENN